MIMYKLKQNFSGGLDFVIRLSDKAHIPFSEDNTDYIAYLAWIAEGNTPEEA